mmetsp:Transcript_39465/g.86028  ORF Transcript_39465/g.86028 Transcript_39465/m.86028 type:complete len:261 (+) Transcript_39465:391-1173(+)
MTTQSSAACHWAISLHAPSYGASHCCGRVLGWLKVVCAVSDIWLQSLWMQFGPRSCVRIPSQRWSRKRGKRPPVVAVSFAFSLDGSEPYTRRASLWERICKPPTPVAACLEWSPAPLTVGSCSVKETEAACRQRLFGSWQAEQGVAFIAYYDLLRRVSFVACPPGEGIDTYRTWETLLSGAVPIVSPEAFRIVSHTPCPAVRAEFSDITAEGLREIVNQTVPTPVVSVRCVEALFLAFWGRQFYAGRTRRTLPAQRSPWQ